MARPKELKYHSTRVYVTKIITFDSAHQLYDYVGPCANLHGHTYKLEVTYSGYPNKIGMVADFKDIKSVIQKYIIDVLDHRNLSEVLCNFNTTAENMAYWMWEVLNDKLDEFKDVENGFKLESIKLYETPSSFVKVVGN